MSRLVLPSYTVIRDTREKEGHGWIFKKHREDRRPPRCEGTVERTLDTGDYTIEGYEDLLTIERKEDYGELWGNYGNRDTFEEEIQRMTKIKHRYILIESHLTKDHFDLSPPQFTKNVPGKALINWLVYLSSRFGVNIIPVGECGMQYSQLIFEAVIRAEKDRWPRQ